MCACSLIIFIYYYRNAALEREVNDLKKQKLAAEAQVNDLQARLNDAVNQRKHYEAEYYVSIPGSCQKICSKVIV